MKTTRNMKKKRLAWSFVSMRCIFILIVHLGLHVSYVIEDNKLKNEPHLIPPTVDSASNSVNIGSKSEQLPIYYDDNDSFSR